MAHRFIIRRIPVIGELWLFLHILAYLAQEKVMKPFAMSLVPAFTSGRRVVEQHLWFTKDKITERYPDATGEIIVVDNDDMLKTDFFPF